MNNVFQKDSYVPLPSQEVMAESIGRGGNGVVAYIYHGGREFAVKKTSLRWEELRIWFSVSHPNVIELCAAIDGDSDSFFPGARTCYQIMPRVAGGYGCMAPKVNLIFDIPADMELILYRYMYT